MGYKIYRCLREDINLPSVWIQSDEISEACIIRIKRDKKEIFVHARPIEKNDREHFNKQFSEKYQIKEKDNAIVISRFFRDRLDIETSAKSGRAENLEIEKPGCLRWLRYNLKAAISHPDFSIRSAYIIALLSLLLGVVGIALGIIGIIKS